MRRAGTRRANDETFAALGSNPGGMAQLASREPVVATTGNERAMEIIPTGAAVGAEIRGVDLATSLAAETFDAIEGAFDEHGVVFFREQRITPAQQVTFTRHFGEIAFNVFGERWSVPGAPEIVVVSNVTENGEPVGIRRAGERWHSDMSYTAPPPRGTMLHAIVVLLS